MTCDFHSLIGQLWPITTVQHHLRGKYVPSFPSWSSDSLILPHSESPWSGMSQGDHKPWPLSVSRSTGTENSSLLQALLAASCFDEISNIADYNAIRDYVRVRGRVDDSGTTTIGLVSFYFGSILLGCMVRITRKKMVRSNNMVFCLLSKRAH